MDLSRRTATFAGPDGALHELRYDLLVGADGVNSRVRRALLLHGFLCASVQQSNWRAASISRRPCLSLSFLSTLVSQVHLHGMPCKGDLRPLDDVFC